MLWKPLCSHLQAFVSAVPRGLESISFLTCPTQLGDHFPPEAFSDLDHPGAPSPTLPGPWEAFPSVKVTLSPATLQAPTVILTLRVRREVTHPRAQAANGAGVAPEENRAWVEWRCRLPSSRTLPTQPLQLSSPVCAVHGLRVPLAPRQKGGGTCTGEHYPPVERNEALLGATSWMNLGIAVLSDRGQALKAPRCGSPCT